MRGTALDALAELARARTVILTTHINPDGDALGSMLALYLHLKHKGIQVQMWLDDNLPSMYAFLPLLHEIARPPAELSHFDLLVVLDAGEASRTGNVFRHFRGRTLNIDHHLSNSNFANVAYVDDSASATGLLILRMLEEAGAEISKDMATCLFTAIATDCGFFRYANTDAETLGAAAKLVGYGAQPHAISEQIQTMPLSKVTALSRVLDTLAVTACGRIATIEVPDGVAAVDVEDTEGFIDYPRNIVGVEVAIMFKPLPGKEAVKLSFRSRRLNVSELARSMGGGGHARAAGCTLKGSLQEVKGLAVMRTLEALRDSQL